MRPHFLSTSDVDILLKFVGELKRTSNNVLGTGGQPRTWDAGDDQVSVGDWIAIPLSHQGIPGLTISGPVNPDGSLGGALQVPTSGDVPGVALCDIYKIRRGGDSGYSELISVDKKVRVYNLSQERLGRDWIAVTKGHYGYWIASPKEVFLEGILLSELEKADGPLTGAKAALMVVIEHDIYNMSLTNEDGVIVNRPIGEVEPSTWKTTNRILSVINRSISVSGVPGTYGKFRKCGGELRPIDLDCEASEAGSQVVVEYEDILYSGGFGSGTYGDESLGG